MKASTLALAAFLAWQSVVLAEVRYRVVRIDPPEAVGKIGVSAGVIRITALDLNNRGEVIGDYGWCSDAACHTQRFSGFFFSDRTGSVTVNVPGYEFSTPGAINDSGVIAMNALRDGTGLSRWEMFRHTPPSGFEAIEGFGGWESEARAINVHGQIAGGSEVACCTAWAFRNSPGGSTENLGALLGSGSGGFAINDEGWVVGGSAEHAFLFRDDQGMVDLGPGIAYDINNAAQVVGRFFFDETDPFGFEEACLWEADGTRRLLGRWAGSVGGGANAAHGLNNFKVVVGYVVAPQVVATIWTEAEGMVALNTLIDQRIPEVPLAGWHLMTANAINDHGQIVGSCAVTNTVWENSTLAVTYRLDPIPPRLAIERTATNLVVSWSPAWPGLVLESSGSLSALDWQAVPTGGTNVVNVSASGSRRFFRLNLNGIRGLCCAPE